MPIIYGGTKITFPDGTLLSSGVIPGMIFGLTLATAGSSATFGIAAGRATDSTFMDTMVLASAYTKTTSAWAVGSGNGAMDTGTVANSTWYHVYLIKNISANIVDVIFSTSASSPTLPSGYTIFRRIGSMQTNGSAQWATFLQFGDYFYRASVGDFTIGGTSTQTLRTLSVPTGIVVVPLITFSGNGTNNTFTAIYIASPSASSLIILGFIIYNGAVTGVSVTDNQQGVPTNTSAQIYVTVTSYSNGATLTTNGWIDRRGKD